MITLLRLSVAAALTLTIAACASAPPPPPEDYAAPSRRQLDAKTQLETGRRY
jgi:predicted small lipoprotein YifL